MPIILAALTVIIQACFIFHVFKTRRPYWWAFIILSFPVIGCVVYYFVEVFPGTQEARKAEKLVNTLSKRVGGDAEFKRRMEEVEVCGSVENKTALARECMERGLFSDAVRLYESCMQGLYASDPNLLLKRAEVQVEMQDYVQAQSSLAQLWEKHADFKPAESALLAARILEGTGDRDAALKQYEALLPVYVGLEAQYRRASLLMKAGRAQEAQAAYEAMQAHARKHRVTHEAELAWLALAKKDLAG